MTEAKHKLWPFSPRASLITAVVLLVGFLLLVGLLRTFVAWPSAQSESVVLIGILALSLLPIGLALLDKIIDRGGAIEYGGVKLAFSQSWELGSRGLTVAANIGVRGEAITGSSTTQILDALKQATACDIVIIDLNEGQAWWETRLLVLLSGAERRGKPHKIVFVGKDAGKEQQFQGWSYASELLPCLLKAHPQFEKSLHAARAVASQLALTEPGQPPNLPLGPLALRYQNMANDNDPATGLPNDLFMEQALQSELGEKVEQQEGSRSINLVRLEELFRPVLIKNCIDLNWPADRQLDTFLGTDAPFLAITQDGRYSAVVSRLALLNQLLKPLLKPR
ncbi:hypothetical protein C8R30_1326 [Nitrosomonas nitrosa]|uniref:hypothetical protein n=1 Tax=Nitrosomonas nitrosa TaxID=52442 RepID=UPI000D31B64E|nr:hypothetical protein [Nitrosomonas nitrosa]PTQ91462.1 hypothetical protein C8R30_1326 [Nitrosomonas nitrosa]